MALDFDDPTTWDKDLTDEDALSLGIWAINTLLHPDASTDAQFGALDFFGEGAVKVLVELRDRLRDEQGDIRAAISNAYYDARNGGRTMEQAADEATAAVRRAMGGSCE